MEEAEEKASNAAIADPLLARALLSCVVWDLCDARVGMDDIELLPSFTSCKPLTSKALISEASNCPHPYNYHTWVSVGSLESEQTWLGYLFLSHN